MKRATADSMKRATDDSNCAFSYHKIVHCALALFCQDAYCGRPARLQSIAISCALSLRRRCSSSKAFLACVLIFTACEAAAAALSMESCMRLSVETFTIISGLLSAAAEEEQDDELTFE